MRSGVKQGVVALALLGCVALPIEPAVASSLHDRGDFAGIDKTMGGSERHDYAHRHAFRPFYQGPAYSYRHGPVLSYYDHEFGPGIGFWGPSVRDGF